MLVAGSLPNWVLEVSGLSSFLPVSLFILINYLSISFI